MSRRKPFDRQRCHGHGAAARGPRKATKAILVVLGLVAMVAASCGTRLTQAQIVSDAKGSTRIVTLGPGAVAGTGSSSGLQAVGSTNSQTVGSAGGSGSAGGTGGATSGTGTGGVQGSGGLSGQTKAATGSAGCTSQQSPVVIGSVGQQSGVVGAAIDDGPKGVSAWVASVNAAGGLNCHPLKYIVLDDGGDPSRNQALTQQLIEQDHAVAIVDSDATISGQGSLSYLQSNKIPIIGADGGEYFYYPDPYYFPQTVGGNDLGLVVDASMVAQLSPTMLRHVGFLACIEQSACSSGPKDAGQFPQMTVVYNGSASISSIDFTSECNSAKQAGAQAFVLAMDPNSVDRIASSCNQVNYHPQYLIGGFVTIPSMASDPNLTGTLVTSIVKPWMLSSFPAVAQYQQALARYGPGVQQDGASMSGWVAAMLFQTAVSKISGAITSASLVQALYTIKNDDLGGLTGPITYTAGQPPPEVDCWFFAQIEGGKFVSPNNGARQCR